MQGCIIRNAILIALAAVPGGLPACGEGHGAEPGRPHRPELVAIAPGTIVADQPPTSWSHLVVKCLPRLASGDLETLPRSAFRTATLIRTVILADVGRSAADPSSFVIRRIGVGLCVPDPTRGDVVVESGRLRESGVKLGMMEKIVLQSAEAQMALGRLIASGPTFALYRGTTVLQAGQSHQNVELSMRFWLTAETERCECSSGRRGPGRAVRLHRRGWWS